MMEAGRVLHHLRNSIEAPRNAILIVGFQAENTLGRRILRGDGEVNIFGEPHPVRAQVFVLNEYSAHADRPELYKGLPNNPAISPLVSLWKGVAKPFATVAMAAVALGSLFHYVTKGPNEVSKELEDELEKEDAK